MRNLRIFLKSGQDRSIPARFCPSTVTNYLVEGDPMNCAEAELYISPLYDGEQVPSGAAQHIAACESCRRVLQDYSHIGVELRLAATMDPEQLPPLKLFPQKRPFDVLWR